PAIPPVQVITNPSTISMVNSLILLAPNVLMRARSYVLSFKALYKVINTLNPAIIIMTQAKISRESIPTPIKENNLAVSNAGEAACMLVDWLTNLGTTPMAAGELNLTNKAVISNPLS